MNTVRVACGQIPVEIDDPTVALHAATEATTAAVSRGAQLMVLPELVNSGYYFTGPEEAATAAETIPGSWTAHLAELSLRHSIVIVAGLAEKEGTELYSSSVIIDHGEILGSYRKTHLWGGESRFFTPGPRPTLVVDTSIGRLATAVCYDIEFPEMIRCAAAAGAQLLAAPVNWPLLPTPEGMWPIEITKAMAHAAEYRIPVAVADRCGTERGQAFTGGSVVVGYDGYPVSGPHVTTPSVPLLLVAEVPLPVNRRLGEFNDALVDRRPELY